MLLYAYRNWLYSRCGASGWRLFPQVVWVREWGLQRFRQRSALFLAWLHLRRAADNVKVKAFPVLLPLLHAGIRVFFNEEKQLGRFCSPVGLVAAGFLRTRHVACGTAGCCRQRTACRRKKKGPRLATWDPLHGDLFLQCQPGNLCVQLLKPLRTCRFILGPADGPQGAQSAGVLLG